MSRLPHDMTPFKTFISPLMKQAWIRKLILLPLTVSGRKKSNKTDDYGNFHPSWISSLEQTSLYVTNIEKSMAFYTKVARLQHNRTCEPEPHPFNDDQTLRCCYMDAKDQKDSLILIERQDATGNIVAPSRHQLFHTAFELEDGRTSFEFAEQLKSEGIKISYGPVTHNDVPPHGDGESGGNCALYVYDPDGHYIEFFYDMDTINNFKSKYTHRYK